LTLLGPVFLAQGFHSSSQVPRSSLEACPGVDYKDHCQAQVAGTKQNHLLEVNIPKLFSAGPDRNRTAVVAVKGHLKHLQMKHQKLKLQKNLLWRPPMKGLLLKLLLMSSQKDSPCWMHAMRSDHVWPN
jgi:hypothetical protein